MVGLVRTGVIERFPTTQSKDSVILGVQPTPESTTASNTTSASPSLHILFFLRKFFFRFLWEAAMTEASPSSSTTPSAALIHVLAIDDSPLDRKVVEKLLKSAMFKVTTVESGKKAMEVLGLNEEDKVETLDDDSKFDIILTDYCMPEMNGYDILKIVKEHSCLNSIPVVIMSSEHDPQRISRCLDAGAEEFIRKPLQLRDMQRLRSYVRPIIPVAKTSAKRKVQLDLMPESKESEKRPCIAGVTVA